MRKLLILTVLLLVAGVGALLALRANTRPDAPLKVYCGISMRPVAEELAREYERETGAAIEFDFGGSETLLPRIEVAGTGDLFITHDPFGDELARKGKVERYVVGGWLIPVLIVARGNPLQLRGLADLAKPGVKLGMMDARHSTCGQIVRDRLAEKGLAESVDANVKVEKRSHQDLALDVALGALDAALVWNFSAELNRERVEGLWLDEPFPETRLVVCLLKSTRQRERAEGFLALCESERGRAVFGKFGYRKR
jgi:molybdate transport system substrate-binding protein